MILTKEIQIQILRGEENFFRFKFFEIFLQIKPINCYINLKVELFPILNDGP